MGEGADRVCGPNIGKRDIAPSRHREDDGVARGPTMPVYTVHEPPPKRYEVAGDPDRFVFVRDGFSFWAFLFGPLWMLRHRMWLVLLGYMVLVIALELIQQALRVSSSAAFMVSLLLMFLVGFEAATLRRFTLGRRK